MGFIAMTYTGWCHAGGVILMFGAFAGGGKYSLIDARGVVAKCRLLESPGRCWAKPQLSNGFRYGVEPLTKEPLTNVCIACESWAACWVVARAAARGLVDAYIYGQEVSSGSGEQ